MPPLSRKSEALLRAVDPLLRFYTGPLYQAHAGKPGICDFAFGNPHEMPLEGIPAALAAGSQPRDPTWFAYKNNEPGSRTIVAESLRARTGIPFETEDVFLTNGAFAGLAVALGAVVDPGDEVLFMTPPWFFYEALVLAQGATPVRVPVDRTTWDLDLDAIAAALSPRTRAVIVNSPNNPTGKIYPPATLTALGRLLAERGRALGRPIYLLSDESYSRIVFDGRPFPSPVAHHPHSFLVYTYGKTLLAPGERIGYLALPPTMPATDRAALRPALFVWQLATAYAFPNATLQHALAELERLSIDIAHLQRKRDRLVAALRGQGYEVGAPEGTFYLLPRSPLADDWAFAELLARHDVLAMPGAVVELPGYFRLSLTASDDMIDRAIPGFAAAMAEARRRA